MSVPGLEGVEYFTIDARTGQLRRMTQAEIEAARPMIDNTQFRNIMPETARTWDSMVADAASKSQSDHGISPAQLRERVEALVERANRDADKHNRLCDIVGDHMRRLDAALKRIEELEKQIAAWRGTEKYEPTPEEDARRQRAIEHINAVNERIAAQKAGKP